MAKRKVKKPRQVSSKRLASIAGRGIRAPSTLTTEEIRTLAASVLSQAADKVKEDRDPTVPTLSDLAEPLPVEPVTPIDPVPLNQLPPVPEDTPARWDTLPETHWDDTPAPDAKPEAPKDTPSSEPSSGSIIDQIKKIFTL